MGQTESNGIIQSYPNNYWQDYALKLQKKCKELEGEIARKDDIIAGLRVMIDGFPALDE